LLYSAPTGRVDLVRAPKGVRFARIDPNAGAQVLGTFNN